MGAARILGVPGDEAYVSAEEAKAGPHPRVPSAHAHTRGADDHQAPADEGPSAARRLANVDASRRRVGGRASSGRLSRSAEFERVYRQGRSRANRYLVLYSFARPPEPNDGDEPRLGVSVSRKVGGAVERNRIKRLLREAFAARRERLPADHDFVIVARPDARELAEGGGLEAITGALDELAVGESAPEKPS